MTLQKIQFAAGVNKEVTRYAGEGRWYDSDKVRFRQGFPEKIGGWERISTSTFLGVCRSLNNWVTLGSQNFVGLGTNLKFYIENGGGYNDITPLRATVTLGANPFETTSGSSIVEVTDTAGGYTDGDFVTFSSATATGGIDAATLNSEYQITISDTNKYTIDVGTNASSSTTGGGSSVSAAYQVNIGPAFNIPLTGWGAGSWGTGTWGVGETSTEALRVWTQSNFGEDLVFGHRGGGLYYWDATNGLTTRGVLVSSLGGASNVPTVQNYLLISDVSRFVFCFGCNELGSATQDPMLIRWSDQESVVNWTPAATNQAGSLRLSSGTEIITAKQARQEVLVWTDSALYSLQYQGAPIVWGAQLVGDNVSIASQNCVAYASGMAFWMGKDKFYKYDGRTQPLRCDLRRYIFNDFNRQQFSQVVAGTNEAYHEVWWWYCSASATQTDRYVVYNYLEDIWYHGSMSRTAWLDSGLKDNPLAATYSNNLVFHEVGTDDNETGTTAAIHAYISSAEFDLEDGHRFAFVWRILPDMTFDGSSAASPSATMTLLPLVNSGSGYSSPASEGGSNSAAVTRTATIPIEQYTGQVYTRVRGRQMAIKVESANEGVTWQLGTPRIDMRPDGRR